MNIDFESVSKMKEKVFVALPQSESGRYSDFEANLNLVVTPPYTTPPQRLCGIYIANLQNTLARAFLASDFEWFWLLNDDQLYYPDTLLRLLSHKKDVVGPLCLLKAAPHSPILYTRMPDGHLTYEYLGRHDRGLKTKPRMVIGGGGMLVHRRVFEAIPDPWWTVTTKQNPKSGLFEQTSEDVDFCAKVEDAGFQIWCDLDVSVIHNATYGLKAVYDTASGQWITVLMRGEEQIGIPAAAPEPSPIEIYNHMPPHQKDWDRQLQAR